jgi:hypothetical protein
VFEITNFEPKSGSKYGGTLLTIYGGPFVPGDLRQTLVKVSPELKLYCEMIDVQET